MVTIFSTCRSFLHPKFGLIQRNAIQSWLLITPKPEILIMGNEPGSKEICEEFGLIHVPDIEITELGTPIISSMFAKAEEMATHDTLCLVSSDILFFDDAMIAVERLRERFRYFMGGVHRYDKNFDQPIDFNDPNWREVVKKDIQLGHPGCGDFFLIRKGTYRNGILPFSIGRASVDNWLVYESTRLGCSVDMTKVVRIVHQNHDHSHIPGDMAGMVNGEEFKKNRAIAGKTVSMEIANSTWIMTENDIVKR